jgi:YhcH/YjgK/YiaL family protein
MIVGQLVNWRDHLSGDVWEEAFAFLMSLDGDSEVRDVELRGEKMYARVMSYATKTTDEAKVEAHREYIDIQISLAGAEGIDWYPTSTLDVKEAYDVEKDRTLYHRYEPAPAHVDNHPGMFTVLYPEDAHMPQLIVDGKVEVIVKAVVKVHVSLVEDAGAGE